MLEEVETEELPVRMSTYSQDSAIAEGDEMDPIAQLTAEEDDLFSDDSKKPAPPPNQDIPPNDIKT